MIDGLSIGNLESSEKFNMELKNSFPVGVHMVGESIDKIYKNGVLIDEIHGHNLVVNSFLSLVLSLIKQRGSGSMNGVQYWAIGSGNSSWDSSMPNPSLTETQLTNEIGRSLISTSDIVFLDENYEETSSPTNILQVSHTFGSSECNGTWREFGLFGGNATATANSGIMINKRHHAVITKTSEMTIERVMRFILTLV